MNKSLGRPSLQVGMVRHENLDDLDAMSMLLARVVDSFEKLEILVQLYRAEGRATSTLALCRGSRLPPGVVVDALASLHDSGIVHTARDHDDAGWCLDPNSVWAVSVEVLVDLYELDRSEVLAFMKHVVTAHARSADVRSSVFTFARRRPKKPPPPS